MSDNVDETFHRVSRYEPRLLNRYLSGGYGHLNFAAEHRIIAEPTDHCPFDHDTLESLPATVEDIHGTGMERSAWQNTMMTLLAGTRDPSSPLSLLRSFEDTMLRDIGLCLRNQWATHIKLTIPAYLVGSSDFGGLMHFNQGRRHGWADRVIHEDESTTSRGFDDGFVSFARVGHALFPSPTGRNVNMMPFIFGDKDSLPTELQCYFDLIERCPYMQEDIGKVGYLTVHESYVDVGECQRREGLHIESPGFFPEDSPSEFKPAVEHRWGMGALRGHDFYDGGIFMASSQKDTSKVWNALVDSRVPGIVDRHGGCEHLRDLLGEGIALEADELIWMTDLTPHEAIQQKESGIRQFFRVVTPNITHWYKDHCTENPKVPLPPNVIVIEGNKFGDLFDANKANNAPDTFDWSRLQDEFMAAEQDFTVTDTIIEPKDLFKTGAHEGKYRQFDEAGVPTHMSDGKPIKKQERKKLLRELEQYRKKIARVIRKKKYDKAKHSIDNIYVPDKGASKLKEPLKVADGVDEQTNIAKKELSNENVSPLPDGWLETRDPTTGEPYYYNEITHMSSWERPVESFSDMVAPVEPEPGSTPESAGATDETEQENPLPTGWIETADQMTGNKYYYNEITNASSWKRPVES